MEESRVAQLATLFDRALAIPQSRRAAFVQEVCGSDTTLREELTALLASHESAAEYFEELAAQIVAPAYSAVAGPADAADRSDLLPRLQAALGSPYRIERELGGGGMSRVFLAEEIRLGRKVVIKVLPPDMAASVSSERFRREIQVAAQLQHPHIVPLLASDASESLPYYTMPFVAGESLQARLARDGVLPAGDATGIWRDVLDALAHAHAHGVVHRDIKPANILLAGRNALVTDFGIARAIEAAAGDASLTGTGLAIGTPAYMAPEQVMGSSDADHRVDIYAAGLVMYEMLEGRPPFSGSSSRELVLKRLTGSPPPLKTPDCPRGVAELVLRCLATDPAARPISAEAVLAALDAASVTSQVAVPRRRLPWVRYGLAALAVAAALFLATELRRASDDSRGGAVDAQPSIAVLPLVNLSADPRDAALADGMTEELIATVGKTGNLRVIASTSVFAFKGRQLNIRQIAESLRVSHVLEGGFQKVGARVRMQVRLVDARDGSTRWSATYNREMGDIFAVQEDIARAIASELDVRLASGARPSSNRRRYTPSIAAYEWYLRGMDVALMRSDSGRRRGLEYFNRAIALDSNFAAAHAGLVRVYLYFTGSTPGDQHAWLARAEQTAMKAVALDDSLAEAHVALGWARLSNRHFASAEAELQRAIALDPNAPRAHEGLARVHMMLGRPAEQLAAARLGMNLDPFSVAAVREMALALMMNGRCDEALELLRPLKSVSPPAGVAGVIAGQCYAAKQMWPEAIAEFRWAMAKSDARVALAFLGYALARAGQRDEAMTILSDLQAGRKDSHGAFGIAAVYAGLRNYDQAFAWLDKAVDQNSMRPYIMGPMFDDLHRDPRFARFEQRMGIQKR